MRLRLPKHRQNGSGLASISQPRGAMQLPMLNLDDNSRNNIVAALGEFVGTFLFLFWSFVGTQISNTPKPPDGANPNPSALLFAALAFGFSLTVNVWAFYRITGGLFNPSVTMALFLVGGLPAMRSIVIVIAQILGGICAAAVVSALFPGDLNVETTLGGGANTAQGLFIEMFLTAQLVFVIIMLAVVKHKSTFLAPVGIGLTFFLTELCGIYYTGGSLNFARSLGPAIVNHHFPHYFWIYFLGPVLGSGLASGFYALISRMRYQTCNPGQDGDGSETAALVPSHSYPDNSRAGPGAGATNTTAAGAGTGEKFAAHDGGGAPGHARNESEATTMSPGQDGIHEESKNHVTMTNGDSGVAGITPTAQQGPPDSVYER